MKLLAKSVGFWGLSFLLALVGGGIGAVLVLLAHRNLTIESGALLAVVVTVCGWAVTSTWSHRNQRELLKYTILNDARLALASAIRREEEWIFGLHSLGSSLRSSLIVRAALPSTIREREWDYWFKQNETARGLLYKETASGQTLTMIMEEYELLYPETRQLRFQLVVRRSAISLEYNVAIMDLIDDNKREQAIGSLEARTDSAMDYAAVLEDLRCHVQNRSIAPLFGGTHIPPRQPPDPAAAITVTKADGELCVMQGNKPWPSETLPMI